MLALWIQELIFYYSRKFDGTFFNIVVVLDILLFVLDSLGFFVEVLAFIDINVVVMADIEGFVFRLRRL